MSWLDVFRHGGPAPMSARRLQSVKMPWHMPRGLRLVRLRAPGILFAVLAISLATPALAMAPHTSRKKRRVSCIIASRTPWESSLTVSRSGHLVAVTRLRSSARSSSGKST
jgi:hypothetical protein